MIKGIFVLIVISLLYGCSASSLIGEAKTGGAVYDYQHTNADGSSCKVNGTSAKEVPGVTIKITKNCELTVEAHGSAPLGDALGAIRGLVDRMPDTSVMP